MKKILAILFTAFCFVTPSWADGTIDTLGAGAALAGTEQFPMFQTANPAVTTTPNAVKTFVGQAGLIPYIAGRYYFPWGIDEATLQNGALSQDTIRCSLGYIRGIATLDTLSGQVQTAAAATNFQLAIYAINAATGKPTGVALASTGNISAAATGNITGTVNSGTPKQLGSSVNAFTPLAFCTNVSSNTFQLELVNGSGLALGSNIGTATLNALTFAGVTLGSYSYSQTFGTWPDLTAASPTENLFPSVLLILHFNTVP